MVPQPGGGAVTLWRRFVRWLARHELAHDRAREPFPNGSIASLEQAIIDACESTVPLCVRWTVITRAVRSGTRGDICIAIELPVGREQPW